MKLTKFKVQNFRSFVDSGWIDCQDVTAIAGVNEAGKSNLLRALWKLKPAFKQDNKITSNDLPIDRYDNIMDSDVMPVFITAQFKLRQIDKEQIKKKFPAVRDFDTVTISRSLSGAYLVQFPITIADDVKHELSKLLVKLMPGFIYYSNYGNLDSNIYLPQMLDKFNKNGVNTISHSKRRTIKLLLMYIGITPEMLVCDLPLLQTAKGKTLKLEKNQLESLTKTKDRYAKLFTEAGEKLTREFNQWWRQGKYTFEIAFDNGNLTIFVTDSSGVRAPLSERSVGMQWFLSFFLVFTLETQFFYTNTILLLDESGATLHGLAQHDLVNFFDELSKTNQIVYSTHSSYMLPTEQLNRTKIVFKDNKGHSYVSNKLNKKTLENDEALYPISTALDMQVSKSILETSTPVITTSDADIIYLNMMKKYLTSIGLIYQDLIDAPFVFIKAGVNGLESTAELLSKNGVMPKIYLNNDSTSNAINETLVNGAYEKCLEKIVRVGDFGDFQTIEDLIPFSIFAKACSNYLVSVFGGEFNLHTSQPFLVQLYSMQTRKPIPDNFRETVARLVADYIISNLKKIKDIKIQSKIWDKLFRMLIG